MTDIANFPTSLSLSLSVKMASYSYNQVSSAYCIWDSTSVWLIIAAVGLKMLIVLTMVDTIQGCAHLIPNAPSSF